MQYVQLRQYLSSRSSCAGRMRGATTGPDCCQKRAALHNHSHARSQLHQKLLRAIYLSNANPRSSNTARFTLSRAEHNFANTCQKSAPKRPGSLPDVHRYLLDGRRAAFGLVLTGHRRAVLLAEALLWLKQRATSDIAALAHVGLVLVTGWHIAGRETGAPTRVSTKNKGEGRQPPPCSRCEEP